MAEPRTATEQWQSFELRMRRRRRDRCVQNATAALEAGRLDEARAAIQEAAALDPSDHAIERLAATIQARTVEYNLRVEAVQAPAPPPISTRPVVEAAQTPAPAPVRNPPAVEAALVPAPAPSISTRPMVEAAQAPPPAPIARRPVVEAAPAPTPASIAKAPIADAAQAPTSARVQPPAPALIATRPAVEAAQAHAPASVQTPAPAPIATRPVVEAKHTPTPAGIPKRTGVDANSGTPRVVVMPFPARPASQSAVDTAATRTVPDRPVITTAVEEPPEPSRGARSMLVAAAVLTLLSGGAGWYWTRSHLAPQPHSVAGTVQKPQRSADPPSVASESSVATTGTAPEPGLPAVADPAGVVSGAPETGNASPASIAPVAPPPAAELPSQASQTAPADDARSGAEAAVAVNTPLPAVRDPVGSSAALAGARPDAVAPRDESSPAREVKLPPIQASATEPARVDPVPVPLPAVETSRLKTAAGEAGPTSPAALPAPPGAVPEPAGAREREAAGRTPAAERSEAAADPAVAAERSIEAVLKRYEEAYTRLDANAVAGVWPSVDRRALARAFQGLASQSVRLGRCEVRVMGDSATAECAGSAEWTPRIGAGPNISRRQWEFQLKNAGSEWVIVSARVRG